LREAAQVAAFRKTILPDVVERRTNEHRLRIWSAGCSTGEEVYTLAILLTEAGLADRWDISLIGTDVNRESLRVAREGQYPAWSFRATPEHVRDRYFESTGEEWRLIERVRNMARFAWMNLGANPLLPPSNDMDVIMCRNVTIYFDELAAQRLYQALVGALAPGGWLVLGPSDPMPSDRGGLERVDVSDAVLWRRAPHPRLVDAPRTPPRTPAPRRVARPQPLAKPRDIATMEPKTADDGDELEAGLLALESGSAQFAVDCLRRATFRDPHNALAQFALGRAYSDLGDLPRALAALLHTERLLAPFSSEELVPGSDSLQVETVRQAVHTYLEGRAA
jgi:chemotaxis protein methyltransferase CheR